MIDSNNQFKRLSQDLIKSVRGVMEATKEGGTPKTDKQKELAAKAPPHDKITHADVLVGRGVLKKHSTTGKLVTKEEAELDGASSKSAEDRHFEKQSPKMQTAINLHTRRGLSYGEAVKAAKRHVKEEVEAIDELSKKTLSSYVKKATTSAASKAMEHGTKKAEADEMDRVMNRHMSFSDKDKVRGIMKTTVKDYEKPREKAGRRIRGINKAVDRLAKEETGLDLARTVLNNIRNEVAQEIDELSRDTVRNYYNKAGEQGKKIADKMKMSGGDWTSDGSDTKTLRKRAAGRDMALKRRYGQVKMSEETEIDEALDAAARYGQHHVAIKDLLKSIDQHVRSHKDDALKHKDYRGKKGVNWGHVGDLAQVHSQLADIHDRLAQQGEYKKSMMGESVDEAYDAAAADRYRKAFGPGGTVQQKKTAMNWLDPKDTNDQAKARTPEQHKKRYQEYLDLAKKGKTEGNRTLHSLATNAAASYKTFHDLKEDIDQIDELSKKTLGAYIKKAGGTSFDSAAHHTYRAGYSNDPSFSRKSWNKGIKRARGVEQAADKIVKESDLELDEARGRPRKNPLPDAKKGDPDEVEARMHIIQQLERAKLSMRGGEPVSFMDGTKHTVHSPDANKIIVKYHSMKPYEKEIFQKKIHASHAGLKAEL